jgi:hypothetical protein
MPVTKRGSGIDRPPAYPNRESETVPRNDPKALAHNDFPLRMVVFSLVAQPVTAIHPNRCAELRTVNAWLLTASDWRFQKKDG